MSRYCAMVLLSFFSWGLNAQQCPVLECDCGAIPSAQWRAQCEADLDQAFNCDNPEDPIKFCRTPGVEAKTLPLVVSRLVAEPVSNLEQSVEQVKLLSWAVRDDNTSAVTLQNRGDLRGALTKRKNENKKRRQLHRVSLGLGQYYLGDNRPQEAEDLYKGLTVRNEKDALLSQNSGLKLWREADAAEDEKVTRVLAQRMLRNAADEMEMAADIAGRLKHYDRASELWAKSAQITDQLLIWKSEQNAKAKVITFYRQRAAARWYQSGLMALLDGDDDFANEAKLKSEKRWALLQTVD
ncbi:MAG: hypothetical protein ACRBBW_15865 [Cellvibrionaceae bacterium]